MSIDFITTGPIKESRLWLTTKDINVFGFLRKVGWVYMNEHRLTYNKKEDCFSLTGKKERVNRLYTIHKRLDEEENGIKVTLAVKKSGVENDGTFLKPRTLFSMKTLFPKKTTPRRMEKHIQAMFHIACERITKLVCNEVGYPDINYKE